jgi:hypothetical protein
MKGLDPKDPSSVRQVGLVLEQQKAQMAELGKDVASRYSTPEAKGAITSFVKTGKFDPVGGTAVVAASAGTPALTSGHASKYTSAWKMVNTLVATELAKQHIVDAPPPTDTADVQSIFAAMTQKQQGKESINTVTQKILANGAAIAPIKTAMAGQIKGETTINIIKQLAHQKDANPFWKNMLDHPEQFRKNGNPDMGLMFDAMSKASILSHGKLNFAQQFLTGFENYLLNVDNAPASDPSYTVADHALEAALFGSSPHAAVLGDYHYQLRLAAEQSAREMQARVERDLSGETQRQAVSQAMISNMGGIAPLDVVRAMNSPAGQNKLYKNTGLDVNTVPSATGTGLTAAQIKAIFGGQN